MDKTKIFINLTKCTEEEQKHLEKLTGVKISYIKRYPYLQIIFSGWNQSDYTHLEGKTELAYPEFIKLFEGGEEEAQVSFSMDEMIAFGKKCFYKGFDKCDTGDANCYTAWREEAGILIEQIKH